MIRQVELPYGMQHWPSWPAWLQWLERHGFYPPQIALPGWAEADDEALTVTVLAGRWAFDGTRRGHMAVVHAPVTHQLEAQALPFPPVYGPGPRIGISPSGYGKW